MRKCKWCAKSGWFLSVNKEGLCQKCDTEIKARVSQSTRQLKESLLTMRRAKDVDTRLSKSQLALQQLREIAPYYDKGLVQLKPSPQELVAHIHLEERQIADRHIERLFKAAVARAQQTAEPESRAQHLDEVLDAIEKFQVHLGQARTTLWKKRIEADKNRLLIEKPARVERDNSRRNAIDQYIEALDMLKADDSGNPENKQRIDKIKKRIRDLGGDLPQRWTSQGGDGVSSDGSVRPT